MTLDFFVKMRVHFCTWWLVVCDCGLFLGDAARTWHLDQFRFREHTRATSSRRVALVLRGDDSGWLTLDPGWTLFLGRLDILILLGFCRHLEARFVYVLARVDYFVRLALSILVYLPAQQFVGLFQIEGLVRVSAAFSTLGLGLFDW